MLAYLFAISKFLHTIPNSVHSMIWIKRTHLDKTPKEIKFEQFGAYLV